MPGTQKIVSEMPADLESLDAALADFDLEGDDEMIAEEIVEELEASSEVLDDDAIADLDIEIERGEVYASQTSAAVASVDPDAAPPAPTKKTRGTKKASSATAPTRTPRDISTVPAEFFQLYALPMGSDLEAVKVETLKLKPAQVKIAEKFENLFTALSVGKTPSTYVMIAFKLLDEKKSVTSADIVGAYKASGLREGTARSQSGQIMSLFATVGIATRAGQTLTMNKDSLIADRIRKLPASV